MVTTHSYIFRFVCTRRVFNSKLTYIREWNEPNTSDTPDTPDEPWATVSNLDHPTDHDPAIWFWWLNEMRLSISEHHHRHRHWHTCECCWRCEWHNKHPFCIGNNNICVANDDTYVVQGFRVRAGCDVAITCHNAILIDIDVQGRRCCVQSICTAAAAAFAHPYRSHLMFCPSFVKTF